MSSADLPDDLPDVQRDKNGRPFVQGEPLPDLPQVLEYAHRLENLADITTQQPGIWGMGSSEWTLTFTYQNHQFNIHTNYHAGLTVYSSADPDCPAQLLMDVVTHFENAQPAVPPWRPPPPLTRRRLLLLFFVALAIAIPLVLFLVLFRQR